MTTLTELQAHLKATKRYAGILDGKWGRLTEAGVLLMVTDGPDTALTTADYIASAARLNVPVAHIRAIFKVESGANAFIKGRPVILPEPHYFSKLTKRRFDAAYPLISYPTWGTRPYLKEQDDRYGQLLQMVRLDVDAGFASCSWGKPQILGANHKVCGFQTSWQFAEAMAQDERAQLIAFEGFIRGTPGLLTALRNGDWMTVARLYNGPAYAKNFYHIKLATAAREFAS